MQSSTLDVMPPSRTKGPRLQLQGMYNGFAKASLPDGGSSLGSTDVTAKSTKAGDDPNTSLREAAAFRIPLLLTKKEKRNNGLRRVDDYGGSGGRRQQRKARSSLFMGGHFFVVPRVQSSFAGSTSLAERCTPKTTLVERAVL